MHRSPPCLLALAGRRLLATAIFVAATIDPASPKAISPEGPTTTVECATRRTTQDPSGLAFMTCGSGPTILLIPGGPGLDAGYMRPMAQDISRMGFQAILIEPRGTGASVSALTSPEQLTIANSMADIEAVRKAVAANRMTVLGHSFGGAIAQAYAATHSERVQKLILLDSVGTSFAQPHGPLDGWRLRLAAGELALYDAARARKDRITAMKIKFRASFYGRAKADAFIAWLSDDKINLSLAPLSEDYERNYDVSSLAPCAPFEVVIIVGDTDWIRGYESQMTEAYPRLHHIVIRHAGHFPWLDAPAATRRALHTALHNRPSALRLPEACSLGVTGPHRVVGN